MSDVAARGHHHAHGLSAAAAGRRPLAIALGLVTAFLVVEVVAAMLTNSLALLADAGHMFTDAAGIGLALLAVWFAARPATAEKSFGYYRLEILAAVANAVILFGVAAFVAFEALQRLAAPPEVVAGPMLVVAVIGLGVNLVSLRLLRTGARSSLNLRGAYLEVVGDFLGSVAVIVAAVVVIVTGWTGIDPIASLVIAALIVPRTWSLLREAVDVLLQATPRGVNLAEVRSHLLGAEGVADAHDLHAWALTSGMNVVSAHVILEARRRPGCRPGRGLRMPLRRLRHGALDDPARDHGSQAGGADLTSLDASARSRRTGVRPAPPGPGVPHRSRPSGARSRARARTRCSSPAARSSRPRLRGGREDGG